MICKMRILGCSILLQFLVSQFSFAQNNPVYASRTYTFGGLRLGASHSTIQPKWNIIYDERSGVKDSLRFNIKEPSTEFEFGFFARFPSDEIFFQGEIYYSYLRMKYTANRTFDNGETQYSHNFHMLSLPLSMGVRLGPVNAHAGFGGSINLNPGKDPLAKIQLGERIFDTGHLFYFVGLGIDVWRLSIDLNYQKTFSDFYYYLDYKDGKEYQLRNGIQRFQLKLGFILSGEKGS